MIHSLNQTLRIGLLLLVMMTGCKYMFAQLTIESCQEKAKANYPLIKQYELIEKSEEYTLSNANKAYLPQVKLTGIGAYIFQGLPQFSLPGAPEKEPQKAQFIGIAQLNQVVWDGGATRTQKEIIKAGAEVEKASVQVALYALNERVNQIYFGILLMDEQINQLAILQEAANRNLNALTLSKDNGLAYQTDVDELKAEILNMDQKKIEFAFSRKGYLEMLAYLIGKPLDDNAKLEKPVIAEVLPAFENNRPEFTLYDRQRKLVTAQSGFNKVNNMPKVGVLGAGVLIQPGISFGPTTMTSIAIGGLSMSWSTAGLYKSSNNRQLDKLQLDKIASQEETFRFNTTLQLRQTNSDIEKQEAVLAKDTEMVNLKTKIRNAYQVKYTNGTCSMNDLVQAMNKESEAKSREALHQIQLLMTQYNYKTITGN